MINPRFHKRWAEIFVEKWDKESHEAAAEWARRVVPSSEGKKVKAEIRKIRDAEKASPSPSSSA